MTFLVGKERYSYPTFFPNCVLVDIILLPASPPPEEVQIEEFLVTAVQRLESTIVHGAFLRTRQPVARPYLKGSYMSGR